MIYIIYSIVAMFSFLAAGCSNPNQSITWTEDALLPSGIVIKINRHQDFMGRHELGQPSSPSSYWLEFKDPESGKNVRWAQAQEPYLIPIAITISKGTAYLLTKPGIGMTWEHYKCPNPIYIPFRHINGEEWKQIDLSDFPNDKIRANITSDMSSLKEKAGNQALHINADETRNSFRNGRPYILNFQGIKQTFQNPPCEWRDTSRDALDKSEEK